MNIQNILQKGVSRLDVRIDNSEMYDYDLVETIICKLESVLDYSELYDYEIIENSIGRIDAKLDSSEFYDYFLGDNTIDYIYRETNVVVGTYLVTEDDYLFKTHDNYYIKYH
jgi:hypothetical protein